MQFRSQQFIISLHRNVGSNPSKYAPLLPSPSSLSLSLTNLSSRELIAQALLLSILPPPPSSSTSSSPSRERTRWNSLLILVWAFEQDPSLSGFGSARKEKKFKGGAQRIEDKEDGEGTDERDVFVSWEIQDNPPPHAREKGVKQGGRRRGGKKGKDLSEVEVVEEGLDELKIDEAAPPEAEKEEKVEVEEKKIYQRYYHLFRSGELTELVSEAAMELGGRFERCSEEEDLIEQEEGGGEWELRVRMKEEVWERENWTCVVRVGWRRKRTE